VWGEIQSRLRPDQRSISRTVADGDDDPLAGPGRQTQAEVVATQFHDFRRVARREFHKPRAQANSAGTLAHDLDLVVRHGLFRSNPAEVVVLPACARAHAENMRPLNHCLRLYQS